MFAFPLFRHPAGVNMRKPSTSATTRGDDPPVKLVCLALMLALVALGCRIVTIW